MFCTLCILINDLIIATQQTICSCLLPECLRYINLSYNEKNSQMYWHLQKTVTIKGQFGWIFINKITKINSDASVHCAEYSLSIFPRISALPLEWQRLHLTGQEYIHVGLIFSIPKSEGLCISPIPRLSSRRKSSNMCAKSWIFPLGYWA